MRRDQLKGFALGVAVTCTVAALTLTAAADRKIDVTDGIDVTFNQANFTPRDPNGKEVEVFVYNGTTYAPLRAICEAAGLDVQYDGTSNTAIITQKGVSMDYITADAAKSAALKDAGISASAAAFVKCEREWDDGRAEYEIEFTSGGVEYEYEIDALTGAVLNASREFDNDSAAADANYITADAAKSAALKDAGISASAAAFVKCELDRDDGRVKYDVEFRSAGMEYDYEIDALTGSVLSREIERDD